MMIGQLVKCAFLERRVIHVEDILAEPLATEFPSSAAYAARYGDPSDACARIASKNHINGCDNPLAQLHRPFDVDFCTTVSPQNPRIAGRIRRTDCSPVSDGAAAIVLTRRDLLDAGQAAVRGR